MANELTDLSVVEISLVDRPANKRALLIRKRQDGEMNVIQKVLHRLGLVKADDAEEPKDLNEILEDKALADAKWKKRDELWTLFYATLDAMQLIDDADSVTDKGAAKEEILEQLKVAAMKTWVMKSAVPDLESFTGDVTAEWLSKKGAKFSKATLGYLTAARGALDTLLLNVETDDMEKSVVPVAELAKAEPVAVADPAIAELMKRNTEQAAELAALTADLKKSNDDRANERWIVKVAAEYKSLPVKPDTFGPLLKRAEATLTAEDFIELTRVLKVGDTALKTSNLFKEQGSGGHDAGGDALARVNAAATELRKSDSNLSRQQAVAKVLEANPALYAEYQADRRAARSVQEA